MRQVTCPQCRESFQAPDDLAQAHCVRCGQSVALETGITADVARPETYHERSPEDVLRTPPVLPEQYASWEEMRDLSPAVQRELTTLATRALPDLRRVSVSAVPEDAPDEINDWGRPLGTIEIPGESETTNQTAIWVVFVASIIVMLAGIVIMIFDKEPANGAQVAVYGFLGLVLGVWLTSRKPILRGTVWIFEAGVLLQRYGRLRACRWEDIHAFEMSNETGRPLFWLSLDHDLTVIISQGHAPEVIPLMEYVEIRLAATQFLQRLRAICTGRRERFGAVALQREGISGRQFFAPWPEVRRVISDARWLFVDWTQRPEWMQIHYSEVSFPYLVMAIAHVMIEEYKRLPQSES